MLHARTIIAVLVSWVLAGAPEPRVHGVAGQAPAGPRGQSALDGPRERAADVRAPLRSEFFVLEESRGGEVRVSGVLRFVRRARPGSTQLESDALFAREDRANGTVRILAVEELTPDCASLSWRQVAADSGRSLRAEWHTGGAGLDVTEWGNGPRWREELASDEGALLPHYLLELLRQGRMATGRVPCFDPLARSIELLEVATWYEGHPGSPGHSGSQVRTVELRRVDRTLFARYRFEGTRLLGFELQQGGATARSVEEAEYDASRKELEVAPAAPRPAPHARGDSEPLPSTAAPR